MTFEQAYAVTCAAVPDVRTFSEAECRRYWELLVGDSTLAQWTPCGKGQQLSAAHVVEIGLQFGRTSSLVAQASKMRSLIHYGVDPFIDPPEAKSAWCDLMERIGHPCILAEMRSDDPRLLETPFPERINLALIDGDHSEAAVANDIALLAPRIVPGGHLLFHDYGVNLPNVYPAVRPEFVRAMMMPQSTMEHQWIEQDQTDTLGVWRKL